VQRSTGASVLRTRRLAGASSTAVHAVALSDGRRAVLRRYAWPGFLDDEPLAARRELEALRFASAAGLAVPVVMAADVTGLDVGDGVPAILMSLVPGTALALPDLRRLAEAAAAVHAVDAGAFPHQYFPWYAGTTTAPPAGATWPALWEAALEVWHTRMPRQPPCFIHRDFHPGNVLWLRGRLSGVVDWANACRGPAGCDVATCRGNLIDLAGPDAAARFVVAYEAVTGSGQDPYWEVASVLEHGSPWTVHDVVTGEARLEPALSSLRRLPRRR
jgi:Ser/Thr protein kinase RdoA (MazF antagonist)